MRMYKFMQYGLKARKDAVAIIRYHSETVIIGTFTLETPELSTQNAYFQHCFPKNGCKYYRKANTILL